MTILTYHSLGPVAKEHRSLCIAPVEFEEHLRLLTAMGRRSVTAEEYDSALMEEGLAGRVWITFDDGALDNLTVGLPALVRHGHRATFFVIVDRSLKGEPGSIPLSGLREMLAAGMTIGCHSATHPRLARLAPADLDREVRDARHRLEDALGVAVTAFCYPYGNFNRTVQESVRTAGFRLACSTIRDNRNTPAHRYALRRAMVQPGRRGLFFRYLFSPLYHWIHARKNARRWHDTEEGAPA